MLPLEIGTSRYTSIYDKHTKKKRKLHPSESYLHHAIYRIIESYSVNLILFCILYSNIIKINDVLNTILSTLSHVLYTVTMDDNKHQ